MSHSLVFVPEHSPEERPQPIQSELEEKEKEKDTPEEVFYPEDIPEDRK